MRSIMQARRMGRFVRVARPIARDVAPSPRSVGNVVGNHACDRVCTLYSVADNRYLHVRGAHTIMITIMITSHARCSKWLTYHGP